MTDLDDFSTSKARTRAPFCFLHPPLCLVTDPTTCFQLELRVPHHMLPTRAQSGPFPSHLFLSPVPWLPILLLTDIPGAVPREGGRSEGGTGHLGLWESSVPRTLGNLGHVSSPLWALCLPLKNEAQEGSQSWTALSPGWPEVTTRGTCLSLIIREEEPGSLLWFAFLKIRL